MREDTGQSSWRVLGIRHGITTRMNSSAHLTSSCSSPSFVSLLLRHPLVIRIELKCQVFKVANHFSTQCVPLQPFSRPVQNLYTGSVENIQTQRIPMVLPRLRDSSHRPPNHSTGHNSRRRLRSPASNSKRRIRPSLRFLPHPPPALPSIPLPAHKFPLSI